MSIRYWFGYWGFHFTRHPVKAWRMFWPWLFKRGLFAEEPQP